MTPVKLEESEASDRTALGALKRGLKLWRNGMRSYSAHWCFLGKKFYPDFEKNIPTTQVSLLQPLMCLVLGVVSKTREMPYPLEVLCENYNGTTDWIVF